MKTRKKASRKKRKRLNAICLLCWIIIPIAIITMFFLDALGLYCLNTERLIVLGVGILAVLFPFLSEITVKNFSIKK